MPDLNSLPQHVAHLPHTGFDMGQSFGFTMSTGMLLPVYQDHLNPGETVYLNSSMMARTQPMVSPAMVDVDFYIDWFFVPSPMLFTAFTSVRWQTNDFLSSVFDSNDKFYNKPVSLPLVDIDASLYGGKVDNYTSVYGSVAYTVGGLGNGFDCVGKSAFRLADHLGFNPRYMGVESDPANPQVFPEFALAYQAIYQNYYRQDERERRNLRCYNLDFAFGSSSPVNIFADGLFQLRYRPYRLDYFTSVKASPLINPINLTGKSGGTADSLRNVLDQVDSYLSSAPVYMTESNYNGSAPVLNPGVYPSTSRTSEASSAVFTQTGVQTTGSSSGTGLSATSVSTAQLRSMFAVEKLLRITGRAKKDYDSQVLAHFGFRVPHDVKHELTHIFSQHGLLHIGEVISTSDTYSGDSGSSLGELSGKGYLGISSLKKTRKFVAPCDGVVMAITSCVPRPRYYGGFDKQNAITDRLSYYQPEFDRLGMQPLYRYESNASMFQDTAMTSYRTGWQYRYEQFKRKYDRVSYAFLNTRDGVNNYASWVYAKSFMSDYPVADVSPFILWESLCPPTALNSIMVMPYNTAWSNTFYDSPWLIYQQDPFIVDFRASVKKVSYMSATGEPLMDSI